MNSDFAYLCRRSGRDISAWSALIGHCFRPKSTYNERSGSLHRVIIASSMNDEGDGILKSSSLLPQSSEMTSSSSTQQPISVNKGDDSKAQKVSTGEDEGTGDPPPKKPMWLVAWIRNQIKTFNPLLLIMAIKF